MASASTRSPAVGSGLPAGVHAGPLGRRLLAHLVDWVVPAAALGVWLAIGRGRTEAVVALGVVGVWGLVVWAMFAVRAAGPGMRLTGLQLVGLADGRPLGWLRFAGRAIVLAALRVTGLGLLLMLAFLVRQRRRQGWHDLVADSVVIRRRPLAPPRGRARAGAAARPGVSMGPAALPVATPPSRIPDASPEPAREPAPDASAPTATPAEWSAVLDDGRVMALAHPVVLGRHPQPRPGEEDAELVKIDDESRTVSKSHLALGVDAEGCFVRDLASTNGTTVTDHGGVSRGCSPQDQVHVPSGTIVSFGDHWLEIRQS